VRGEGVREGEDEDEEEKAAKAMEAVEAEKEKMPLCGGRGAGSWFTKATVLFLWCAFILNCRLSFCRGGLPGMELGHGADSGGVRVGRIWIRFLPLMTRMRRRRRCQICA